MILLFYYLAILNLVDTALTVIGMERSIISEANPLMSWIYSIDVQAFIALKLLLSITLLLFIFFKAIPKSALILGLTIFASACYTLVIGIHGFWLVQMV